MNPLVEEFIEKRKREQSKKSFDEKQKLLRKLKIGNKIYAPDNRYSMEYSHSEYENGSIKYYKFDPVDISDEEYEILLKYCTQDETEKKNIIGTIFKGLALFWWGAGDIAALILFISSVSYADYTYMYAGFIVLGSCAVVGLISMGIGEVIHLLQSIKNNTTKQ